MLGQSVVSVSEGRVMGDHDIQLSTGGIGPGLSLVKSSEAGLSLVTQSHI